jgi:hypothetical protein
MPKNSRVALFSNLPGNKHYHGGHSFPRLATLKSKTRRPLRNRHLVGPSGQVYIVATTPS